MKKNITLIVVTLAIISIMHLNAPNKTSTDEINVTAVYPIEKNITDHINAEGRIKEGNRKDIYVKHLSQVKDVFVDEGQSVNQGDPLFEVEEISEEVFNDVENNLNTSEIYEVFKEYGIEIPDISSFSYISSEKNIISSPIDGIITDLNIKMGENIAPIKKAISVSDFSNLYIETMIPEAYSTKIKPGTDAKISAEAFGENVYSGKIESIKPTATYIPSITGEGKTFISAVIRPNSSNKLFIPELTVNAKITVNTIKNALILPYECIRQDENGNEFVFCVENDNTARKHLIKTGHELENEVEIISGVNKKNRIIFNPDENLKEGMQVTVSVRE